MVLIDHFKEISSLKKENLTSLLNEFNDNPLNSVGTIAKLEKLCLKEEIDIKLAKNFYRLLAYICDFLIDKKSIDIGIKEFEEKIIEIFPEETKYIWDFFKDNLDRLKEFIIKRKENLLSSESNKIEKISIICDARPIYNIERNEIEKYIFPLVLSISFENDDKRVFAELNEEDFEKLKREIEYAYKKLNILKENLKTG